MTEAVARLERRIAELRKSDRLAAERERLLNDGYAAVLEMEVEHGRHARRLEELAAHAHESDAAMELRRSAAEMRRLERDLATLRSALAQAEAY